MLHEWLHISWGSAQILKIVRVILLVIHVMFHPIDFNFLPGTDYGINLGMSRGYGTPSRAYGPGRAKLLARYIFHGGDFIREGIKEASRNSKYILSPALPPPFTNHDVFGFAVDNYVCFAVVEFMYKTFGL